MADLKHAHSYLEPSKWESSPLSRVAWHAWPAVAALAVLHVAVNLGVLAFDRSKVFPLRLLEAASIVVTLFVIWGCFDATALLASRAS